MRAFVIDIETGGLVAGYHSLLEICIREVSITPDGGVSDEIAFYELVKPKTLVISEVAFNMHRKNGLLQECFELGLPEEGALDKYKQWAFHAMYGKAGVAVGFNVKFDTTFLKEWSKKDFFHYRTIDPRQKWLTIEDEGVPPTEECFKRAGIPLQNELLHRAKDDCDAAVKLFKAMFA